MASAPGHPTVRLRRSIAAISAAAGLALVAVAPASAQATSHPAGIHVGTCPTPGNAVVSLWDVSGDFLVDGDAQAGAPAGSQLGYPTEASVTTVEIPLEDLVGSEHAILLHASSAEMDRFLACGDIGGQMLGTDALPVALAPVGMSAWSGIALLTDEGDGTTTVTIYAFEGPGVDTGTGANPAGSSVLPSPAAADGDDAVGDDAGDEDAEHEDEDARHEGQDEADDHQAEGHGHDKDEGEGEGDQD